MQHGVHHSNTAICALRSHIREQTQGAKFYMTHTGQLVCADNSVGTPSKCRRRPCSCGCRHSRALLLSELSVTPPSGTKRNYKENGVFPQLPTFPDLPYQLFVEISKSCMETLELRNFRFRIAIITIFILSCSIVTCRGCA
jgi:hypothetical protein